MRSKTGPQMAWKQSITYSRGYTTCSSTSLLCCRLTNPGFLQAAQPSTCVKASKKKSREGTPYDQLVHSIGLTHCTAVLCYQLLCDACTSCPDAVARRHDVSICTYGSAQTGTSVASQHVRSVAMPTILHLCNKWADNYTMSCYLQKIMQKTTYLISLCLPVSITTVTSSMVKLVSATLVATTTFKTPGGGRSNTRDWVAGDKPPCNGRIRKPLHVIAASLGLLCN